LHGWRRVPVGYHQTQRHPPQTHGREHHDRAGLDRHNQSAPGDREDLAVVPDAGAGVIRCPAPFFSLVRFSLYVESIRMDVKLTLKLDSVAIERARRYARRRGTSLSRMVEQYFNSFSAGAGEAVQDQSLFVGTTVGTLLDEASRWPESPSLDENYGPVL